MKMLSESQEVQGNSDLEAIQSADKTAGSEVDLSDRQKQILVYDTLKLPGKSVRIP